MKPELKNKIIESNNAVKLLQGAGYSFQGCAGNDFSKVHIINKEGKRHEFSNAIDAKNSLTPNFKIGDKVKIKGIENSPIITVVAVFTDNKITGKHFLNSQLDEKYNYYCFENLTLYKSAECSEVLRLMDESSDANYCQSLKTVLAKYPNIDRKELEEELNQFV